MSTKPNHTLLLEEIRKEYNLIQSKLNECLNLEDYEGAEYYVRARWRSWQKLKLIRALCRVNDDSDDLTDDRLAAILDRRHPLVKYRPKESKNRFLDSDIILTHLYSLKENTTKELIIYPTIKRDVGIKLIHVATSFRLALFSNEEESIHNFMNRQVLIESKMNFIWEQDELITYMKITSDKDVQDVMQMLSILLLEVFISSYRGDAYIKILH